MLSTRLLFISPYGCRNIPGLLHALSHSFSVKENEVFYLSGMEQLKDFSNSFLLPKTFSHASKLFGRCVKIVIMGPLHQQDMRSAEHYFHNFDEVFYMSLSDDDIFVLGGRMIIPGCPFKLPPGEMLDGIRTHDFFVFDEKTFKKRSRLVVPRAFPQSPEYSLEGVCSPYSKKRKSSEAQTPSILPEIVVEEAPASSTTSSTAYSTDEETRLRFSGVPEPCIIRTGPEFNFIKTVGNKLCFPVGTKLKFEFPEDEVKGHSKDIFFGPRRNCVGLYDYKNEVFYIYP